MFTLQPTGDNRGPSFASEKGSELVTAEGCSRQLEVRKYLVYTYVIKCLPQLPASSHI